MELKEIKEIVAEILQDIEKNTFKNTYRKYDTFLTRIGMDKKRNFQILAKFDYQFTKKQFNALVW
jgi:ATP-dependent helicase IRC3